MLRLIGPLLLCSNEISPEFIHHPHQHEESVLTDALLKCVWTMAEMSVCAVELKNKNTENTHTSREVCAQKRKLKK